jgi:hypothetical protein
MPAQEDIHRPKLQAGTEVLSLLLGRAVVLSAVCWVSYFWGVPALAKWEPVRRTDKLIEIIKGIRCGHQS